MGLRGTPVGKGCLFEIWQRMDLNISSDTTAKFALTVQGKADKRGSYLKYWESDQPT